MPTFNRNDTQAILAFFGQTSTRGSTQPRDEAYYTSNTPTNNRPTSTRRPSSNVVTPTTAPGGLPRRPTTVPRDEQYYTSTKPTYKPPAAPKLKRNTTQPADEERYTNTEPPNRWRQEIQQPVFRGYDVGPQRVEVSVGQRPNTGPSAVQQSGTVGGQTARSPIAPRLPAYRGPADDEFYTQRDAPVAPLRTPGQPPVAMASPVLPVARAAWDMMPDSWDEAAQLARYGMQGLWGTVADTAAVERAQQDIAQRRREREDVLGQSWGQWIRNVGQNLTDTAPAAVQQFTQGGGLAGAVGTVGASLLSNLSDISSPTRWTKDAAFNALSGLQAGADLAYNQPYLPGNLPPSAFIASAVDEAGKNFQSFARDPMGVFTGANKEYNAFGDWLTAVQNTVGQYKQAVTPTAQQRATLTPDQLRRQQERAYLNTFGGLQSLTNTFDALVDQPATVDKLNAEAQRLFQAGANEVNEDVRQELWYQAAQKGYEAQRLQSTHPIQIVNENTNIGRQLLTEILLPDVTDLLGGVFSVLELTPKARRLNTVANQVLTPQEQAVKALQSMIVNPANQAAIMAERSTYNKFWNLWTTGNARANIAADKMQRFVTNLLSEVETPQDARLLLNQLATDPTKLLTGIQANVYQSAGMLARAGQDGLIKFGNMNLQNLKEPLRIYQQAAQDFLQNSKALQGGPILNKVDFMVEFTDAMKQAGYRFYNVADEASSIPTGTKTTRLRAVTGGQYVVEYVDSAKKVIGQSDPMLIADARKLQNSFKGGQVSAPQSAIKAIGSTMRKIVSIPFIIGNPGTFVTNGISGVLGANVDGVFSTESRAAMRGWKAKLWGVDPTLRGLEGADTAQGFANQTMGGRGILGALRNAYSQIDESVGERVWHASAQHALRKAGKPLLQQTLTPILNNLGIVQPREIRRITNHLFEVGMSGGNLAEEWARLMTGNSRVFSLGDVNPQWLGAIPETVLEDFYTIIRTAPDKATATTQLQAWADKAAKYWDNLIATAATEPQRHVWMRQEVAEDTADLTQTAKVATKYGNVPVDEANAWVKSASTQLQDIQRRQATLMQLVAEAKDPANRYALYNIWGQVTDLTANVRAQLTELAEKVGQTPKGAARQAAWQQYWTEARRLWDERNTSVNNLLEQATTAIASGQPFTPQFDVWRQLERTAQTNEAKLWETLRLEPQSGTYDQRLAQVIEAGRQITDKAIARTYAAARRFTQVDAMDHIISAEHDMQLAGAKARAYLDKVLENTFKSGKWEEYFSIRNETWRQLRAYERDVWGLAERNIVREGLASEATTGLRFDAGPDGTVELLRPEQRTVQQTSRLGPEKTVTQRQVTVWSVRREDGTVTTVPDNMVPQELKDRYTGVTPEEIEAQTQLELDNIASAEPFAPEAQRIIDGPDIDSAPSPYAETEIIEPELQRLLNEPVQVPSMRLVAPDPEVERGALLAERAQASIDAAKEARNTLRTEWDRVAKGENGYLKLDSAVGLYVRGGIANVPENKFADLYGKTIAGIEINNQDDVNRLLQQYYDLGQVRRQTPAQAVQQPATPQLYQPSPQQVEQVRASVQKAIERSAQRNKLTPQQVEQYVQQALTQIAQSDIAVAVPKNVIDSILSDGRLKTQFETGTSGATTNKAWRAEAEWKGLGIPEDLPAAQRPIYGYMNFSPETRSLTQRGYGDITFILDDKVRSRTTIGAGDTMDNFRQGNLVGAPIDNPNILAADHEVSNLVDYARTGDAKEFVYSGVGYVEAQVQGGVALDDVAYVLDEKSVLAPQQVQAFQQRGIQVLQGDAAKTAGKLPARRPPAFTPSTQPAAVEGYTRFTATEPPTTAVEVRTTPAQSAPLTLNDLRRLADEAGIQTASEAGKPINKRLLNTINKDLKIKANRLEDLTPDQIEAAADALRRRAANTRTLESTVPLFDYEKWARENVGKGLDLSPGVKKAQALKTPPVAAAAPDIAQGAAFAKQQIDNILQYTLNNLDEILKPARGLGQGQSLRALDEFRRKVLPAWDNAKYIASEYGNKMRGFTLIDFINETRLDEIMGLWMPYGFWGTRTGWNSAERALFQPHIWRRVMQAEQGIRDMQEQRDDPQRYEGGIPVDLGDGNVVYLRLLPSKYWQAFGLFTHNDYADPESANSALGFAMETLRSANLNPFPWNDAVLKLWEGNTEDIYPVNYTPQTRIAADLVVKFMGANAPTWAWTSFLDNTAARVLNNMAVKGEITNDEAMWAHQYIRQMTTGEAMLPEQQQLNQPHMQAIVNTALQRAAGDDLWPAVSAWLTGVNAKPYDQAEAIWRGAGQDYYNNQYGPGNPYGSYLASQVSKEDAMLGWSKNAVSDPTRDAPGVMLVNELKKREKETVNQDLMSATDAWILAQKETPTNGEINEFKAQYVIGKYGDQDVQPTGDFKYPFFADVITAYLDNKYPSAQPFEGDGSKPRYTGYAPEEVREKVRTAAYYQALDELADEKPTSPGKGKSREEYKAYDEAKANYEAELEARVTELISDPEWLAIQSGTFLRTTRTGESEGSYRLIAPTLDNAFGVPMRPTGNAQDPYMSGLVPLAGSPADAKAIIEQERTKYMGPVEKRVRAENEENGDKSGFYAMGNRRYPRSSRGRRRRGGSGGYRRYYGGGGGGSSGFRYPQMPDAQGLSSSLWSQDDVRAWRPWNTNANDWLYAGRDIGPERLEDWRPIRV